MASREPTPLFLAPFRQWMPSPIDHPPRDPNARHTVAERIRLRRCRTRPDRFYGEDLRDGIFLHVGEVFLHRGGVLLHVGESRPHSDQGLDHADGPNRVRMESSYT